MVSIRRRSLLAAAGASIKKSSVSVEEAGTINSKRLLDSPILDSPNSSNDGSASLSEPEVKKRPYKRKIYKNLSSLRGVYLKNMKWQAAIKVGKKQVHLGTVATREDAARLYDRAAYMCQRRTNFELPREEKRELDALQWEEFLEITRREITAKKIQNRLEAKNKERVFKQSEEQQDEDDE